MQKYKEELVDKLIDACKKWGSSPHISEAIDALNPPSRYTLPSWEEFKQGRVCTHDGQVGVIIDGVFISQHTYSTLRENIKVVDDWSNFKWEDWVKVRDIYNYTISHNGEDIKAVYNMIVKKKGLS